MHPTRTECAPIRAWLFEGIPLSLHGLNCSTALRHLGVVAW